MKPIDKLRKERKEKVEKLRDQGINPYPYNFEQTHHAQPLVDEYDDQLEAGEETEDRVKVAGRLMLSRNMGKITFANLEDESGEIQLFFKEDTLKEEYDLVDDLDLGDIVGVEGFMFKTKKGETTVHVESFDLLCKALRAPPEKYYGMKDRETRYRKRHLDLMMNPEVRQDFKKRYKMIREIQKFLDDKGFIEVETPILQPVYGGAAARPFITTHNSLDMDMYLRISDELYLKRLIIGGFERVYEIGRDFRNEGIDTSHNPEFTMIEWYQAYGDLNTGLEMVEKLVSQLAKKITGSMKVEYQGEELDFTPPWNKMTMKEAIKEYAGLDVEDMSDDELRDYMKENNIEFEDDYTRGLLIAEIFEETCEDHLVQPTFITEFPVETTPLCKQLRSGDEDYVERFEPYAAGMELGNAYSELNDPQKQKELFEAQEGEEDEESWSKDDDFVEALEYGMPPTSGVGLGIDRLAMLFTDSESIRDVVLFPTLKPKDE